jgi:serine/threonine-protein kinase
VKLDVEALQATTGATRSGALVGTPLYMSPEQLRAKAIDLRADLWSLAIVTYECLCGAAPYAADSLADLIVEITQKPIPKPSSLAPVPPGFDEWFAHATSRAIDERFPSAKAQLEALRPVLEDAPDLRGSFTPNDRAPNSGQATLAASVVTGATPAPPRWRVGLPVAAAAALLLSVGAWWLGRYPWTTPEVPATTPEARAAPPAPRASATEQVTTSMIAPAPPTVDAAIAAPPHASASPRPAPPVKSAPLASTSASTAASASNPLAF